MNKEVRITRGAEQDLNDILAFIAKKDRPLLAERLLDDLLDTISQLAKFSERGAYPKELLSLGMKEFQQAYFQPYRLIYRILNNVVYVYRILDERRNVQGLLERRLLRD